MKPIEAGCLAIVISGNSEFTGMTVTVIEAAPDENHVMPNGISTVGGMGQWVIETPRPVPCPMWDGRTEYVTMGTAHERKLLRIDDYDPSTEETTSDREVTA